MPLTAGLGAIRLPSLAGELDEELAAEATLGQVRPLLRGQPSLRLLDEAEPGGLITGGAESINPRGKPGTEPVALLLVKPRQGGAGRDPAWMFPKRGR
jgi:hypothetical protein